MVRKIVEIDEDKCNGCGACAEACHEGAIAMVNGKARLIKDDYCDGLGDCLPECPADAIRIVEREAADYDRDAVEANMAARQTQGLRVGAAPTGHSGGCPSSAPRQFAPAAPAGHGGGCPSSAPRQFAPAAPTGHGGGCPSSAPKTLGGCCDEADAPAQAQAPARKPQSELRMWPVQIQLAPVRAPFFQGAKLLIAADCTAFAYGNFHEDFIKDHVVLVGCPKLDPVDYSEKLTTIIRENDIKSVSLVRMEVPCCGGLQMAAMKAMQASGKFLPWSVTTISLDGKILEEL